MFKHFVFPGQTVISRRLLVALFMQAASQRHSFHY
jgi:hypothetical protein